MNNLYHVETDVQTKCKDQLVDTHFGFNMFVCNLKLQRKTAYISKFKPRGSQVQCSIDNKHKQETKARQQSNPMFGYKIHDVTICQNLIKSKNTRTTLKPELVSL